MDKLSIILWLFFTMAGAIAAILHLLLFIMND